MILKGKVVNGIGDLSVKMRDVPGLLDAYEKKTGMRFFPGSLNIRLEEPYSAPKDCLRLEKEEYGGKVSVNIIPSKIFGRKAFLVRTDKAEAGLIASHPKTIVEVICDVKLRDFYSLKDGDSVTVELE